MDDRGFTIIELVLVIIVAAIIAAVAVPQFSRYWAGIKLGNATMKIASDIRYAQNRATTTQQRSQVNFAAGGISYTINSCAIADYTSSTCNCGGAGWSLVKTIDLSDDFKDVTISGVVNNCVEFDSLGRPYYNTTCNTATSCNTSAGTGPPRPDITVQYSGAPNETITVQTQTGMVSY